MTHDLESAPRRPRRTARLAAFAVMAAAAACANVALSADNAPADLEGTRAVLEKWVQTRRVISQEQRDWALGREMLNERIDLVRRENDALRAKIREAEASITEADKKRSALSDDNDKLKQTSAGLAERVQSLETSTRQLLARLPDPIRERVKPLSQRLPAAAGDTKLSLAERFQNVVGILNEVNKFSREITVTSEVRQLADGSAVEVTALYVGIGQGYYVSANGSVAGTGSASPSGWVWTPANDVAPQIARAIAILKNEQVASFVQLPVDIQ